MRAASAIVTKPNASSALAAPLSAIAPPGGVLEVTPLHSNYASVTDYNVP
jgi:hypothetical protein